MIYNIIIDKQNLFLLFVYALWMTLLLFLLFKIKTNKEKNNMYYLISFLLLITILIPSFRYIDINIGGRDNINYKYYFSISNNYNLIEFFTISPFEPMFDLMIWLTRKLTKDYTYFLLICNVIFYFCFLKLISILNRMNVNFSLLCIFNIVILYLQSFNILRNILAIFLSLYSIDFLIKKRYKYFVLLTLFLCGIHITSISLFIPLIFDFIINKVSGNKKNKYIILNIAFFIVLIFITFGLSFILKNSRYISYIGSGSFSIAHFLLFILILLLTFRYAKKIFILRSNKILFLIINSFFPFVILQIYSSMFYRFVIFSLIYVYIYINSIKSSIIISKFKINLIILFLDFILILKIVSFFIDDIQYILPIIF